MKPNRCSHRDALNHRCRDLVAPSHPFLCYRHARNQQAAERKRQEAERKEREAARLGAELASLSGEYKTASDINRVLGKLFDLLAQNRIDRAKAHTLAYIAQLMLITLPTVRNEIQTVQGFDVWRRSVLRSLALNRPPANESSQAVPPQSVSLAGAPAPVEARLAG
jgi:hypothetical protein